MTTEWEKLYAAALAVAVPKVISEQMCSGGVGAAVLTENGNVYTGFVSIPTARWVCVRSETRCQR